MHINIYMLLKCAFVLDFLKLAGMRVSADSGYGYHFLPVAGCGRGCGHGFLLAGAGF